MDIKTKYNIGQEVYIIYNNTEFKKCKCCKQKIFDRKHSITTYHIKKCKITDIFFSIQNHGNTNKQSTGYHIDMVKVGKSNYRENDIFSTKKEATEHKISIQKTWS